MAGLLSKVWNKLGWKESSQESSAQKLEPVFITGKCGVDGMPMFYFRDETGEWRVFEWKAPEFVPHKCRTDACNIIMNKMYTHYEPENSQESTEKEKEGSEGSDGSVGSEVALSGSEGSQSDGSEQEGSEPEGSESEGSESEQSESDSENEESDKDVDDSADEAFEDDWRAQMDQADSEDSDDPDYEAEDDVEEESDEDYISDEHSEEESDKGLAGSDDEASEEVDESDVEASEDEVRSDAEASEEDRLEESDVESQDSNFESSGDESELDKETFKNEVKQRIAAFDLDEASDVSRQDGSKQDVVEVVSDAQKTCSEDLKNASEANDSGLIEVGQESTRSVVYFDSDIDENCLHELIESGKKTHAMLNKLKKTLMGAPRGYDRYSLEYDIYASSDDEGSDVLKPYDDGTDDRDFIDAEISKIECCDSREDLEYPLMKQKDEAPTDDSIEEEPEKFLVHGREPDELDYVIREYRRQLARKQKEKEEATLRAQEASEEEIVGEAPKVDMIPEAEEAPKEEVPEVAVVPQATGSEKETMEEELPEATESGELPDKLRGFMDEVHSENQKRSQQLLEIFQYE